MIINRKPDIFIIENLNPIVYVYFSHSVLQLIIAVRVILSQSNWPLRLIKIHSQRTVLIEKREGGEKAESREELVEVKGATYPMKRERVEQ